MNIGDKIEIDHYLVRESEYLKGHKTRKYWKRIETRKIEVYLISIVNLSNGVNEDCGDGEIIYAATKSLKAYRVSKGLRCKPFYVRRN